MKENKGRATLYRTAVAAKPNLRCLALSNNYDTRIDRLEIRLDQFATEMRNGFWAVDGRLCKVESRLDQIDVRLDGIDARLEQTSTKADLHAIEARLDQTATKADLAGLRGEVYQAVARMNMWMLATMITIIGSFMMLLFGLRHWNG